MFCCCSRACFQQGILWTTLCPQSHSSSTSKLSGLCIFQYIPHQQLLFSKCDWTIYRHQPLAIASPTQSASIQASCGILFGLVFIPFEFNLREYSSFISWYICCCENFTGALSSYTPNAQATSSAFRPVCLSPLLKIFELNDETVQPMKSRIEELPPLVEASKLIFYLNQS